MKKYLVLFLSCLFSSQLVSADIIPANRVIDWGKAGVPNGIPARANAADIHVTLGLAGKNPGDPQNVTVGQIKSALDGCPKDKVVKLNQGTYNIDTPLVISKDYVTLRGAGMDKTILNYTGAPYPTEGIRIGKKSSSADLIRVDPPYSYISQYAVGWTGGYAQGTTDITLSSVTGLVVGQILGLDQMYDGDDWTRDTVCYRGCKNDASGIFLGRNDGLRNFQQYVLVKAINPTTKVVTISPGLYAGPDREWWRSTQTPQAFWNDGLIQYSGVEDLTFKGNGVPKFNIQFTNAYACWAKNVKTHMASTAHVNTICTKNIEVRHCYITQWKVNDSGHYGIEPWNSSDGRYEDNIFDNYSNAVSIRGTSGSVFAFNYFINDAFNAGMSWNFFQHGGHPYFNLVEGNFARNVTHECVDAYSSLTNVFRNRLYGSEGSEGGYTLRVMRNMRYLSFVGNVLGPAGGTGYSYEGPTQGNVIYSWDDGQNNDPEQTQRDTRSDSNVMNTLIRSGNYDTVNKDVVWSSNPDHTIPASYAYPGGKPAWFGDRPWPAVNPLDPNDKLSPPESPKPGIAINIPAAYRYVYGIDPPPGGGQPPSPKAPTGFKIKANPA